MYDVYVCIYRSTGAELPVLVETKVNFLLEK
jgi:hypothetical protein